MSNSFEEAIICKKTFFVNGIAGASAIYEIIGTLLQNLQKYSTQNLSYDQAFSDFYSLHPIEKT